MATAGSEGAAPKRGYLPAEVRREKILDAATEVFAQHGPGVSLDVIAERAGVKRTVLYYYFPSKAELFLALFGEHRAAAMAAVAGAIEGQSTLEQRARAAMSAILAHVRGNPDSFRVLFTELEFADPEIAAAGRDNVEGLRSAIAAIAAPHLAEFGLDVDAERVRLAAEMMIGGLVAIWRWAIAHPETSDEAIVDTCVVLVLSAIYGTPPEAPQGSEQPRLDRSDETRDVNLNLVGPAGQMVRLPRTGTTTRSATTGRGEPSR